MSATSDAWPIYAPASQAKPLNAIVSAVARDGIYIIASVAERATLLAALAANGQAPPSVTRPVFAFRADATAGLEFEYTTDGAAWRVLPTTSAAVLGAGNTLDYSLLKPLDPATITASSPVESFPLGWSGMSMSGANATAGGWPTSGGSAQLLVMKLAADRSIQILFRNSNTNAFAAYRVNDTTGVQSPWFGLVGPYTEATGSVQVPSTSNPTATVQVTYPAGRFTVTTPPPLVFFQVSQGTSWIAGLQGSSNATFVVQCRNVLGATGTNPLTVYWRAMQATSTQAAEQSN